MENILLQENSIRLAFFLGMFISICSWELIKPRRKLSQDKLTRWTSNFGIITLNTFLLRIIFPTTAVGFASWIQDANFGLFHFLNLFFVVTVIASVLLLDLAIYLQHLLFHRVPILWRLHRMHHTDLDLDVTTGARFHPIEILLSMSIKFLIIFLIGAPPISVLIFEVLLNAGSMFNHGNIYLPPKLDLLLRNVFVTPDMHRIHHSVLVNETNSNFGFSLTWWDKIFRTYKNLPKGDQRTMPIGIETFRKPHYLKFHWLLIQPFLKERK